MTEVLKESLLKRILEDGIPVDHGVLTAIEARLPAQGVTPFGGATSLSATLTVLPGEETPKEENNYTALCAKLRETSAALTAATANPPYERGTVYACLQDVRDVVNETLALCLEEPSANE